MTNLDDRVRKYLQCFDPAITGQHGHNTLYRATCALVNGYGLDPESAYPFLAEYNERCAPPWNQRDLRRKLNQALVDPNHPKPRGHLLGAEVAELSTPSGTLPKPPKPTYQPDKLEELASRLPEEISAEYLEARSPFTCWNRSPAGALAKLYQPGEHILVFTNHESQGQELWNHPGIVGNFAALNCYRRGLQNVWFLSNPVDGHYHWNPREAKDSRRSEESITAWRYAVIESDEADPGQWLTALVQLYLPISAIYSSGKRSIHALVRIDADSKTEWDKIVKGELLQALTTLGADPGALTAVRLTRLPNCKREETGNLQKLLYLDPEPDDNPICQKPLRETGGSKK